MEVGMKESYRDYFNDNEPEEKPEETHDEEQAPKNKVSPAILFMIAAVFMSALELTGVLARIANAFFPHGYVPGAFPFAMIVMAAVAAYDIHKSR